MSGGHWEAGPGAASTSEVFDTEVFAINRALLWFEGLQGTGRRFTIFTDSTAAIGRVRTDASGPAQRFAVAAIEAYDRIHARGDQITIRWVPSHVGIEGNETADRYAMAAADQSAPWQDEATPEELLDEASLSYITRTATEARSRATAEWVRGHVRAERRYRPPPGGGPRRGQLGGTRKELAGRFYQLLSGHANIGSFLHRIGTVDDDTC